MNIIMLILHTKNIEQHLEKHYEIESNKNYFLQQLDISEEFYEDRFFPCVVTKDLPDLKTLLLDEYGTHESIDNFFYLKRRTFTSFFRENQIDVPRCFNETGSVRRSNNELHLLKFNNYLMRDGKRAQSFTYLSKALWSSFESTWDLDERPFKTNYSWRAIFINLNYLGGTARKLNEFSTFIEAPTSYGHVLDTNSKYMSDKWSFYKWFFKNIYQILPMFSFYIYRVDKKIFKNTRGKSGKHTFIWKYVTPYKRMFLVMHWLLKELRVKQGRSLTDRLDLLVKSIVSSPKSTWAYKVKKFSHNYVYRNSRQTLAETYRTSTK